MKTHKDWFTAIHEAGHVVTNLLFEEAIPEGFEYVTIESNEVFDGRVMVNKLLHQIDPGLFDFYSDDESNRELTGLAQFELEARLCHILAGEAATYIETGKRDEVGSGRDSWEGDFAACMKFIEQIFPVGDDPESTANLAAHSYLEALFWRTVHVLSNPLRRQLIAAIAEGLIDKRTLSADQCRRIQKRAFEAACSPS